MPLSEMVKNAGIGAKFYNIDFGLCLVADDILALTTSRHRLNLMSDIYERYAKEYSVIYEYSKLELNILGVNNATQEASGLEDIVISCHRRAPM